MMEAPILNNKYTFEEFKSGYYKFQYDTKRYPFQDILRKIFDDWDSPIEALYTFFNDTSPLTQVSIDDDTKTKFHRKYYDSPHYEQLVVLYYNFIKEQVLPLFLDNDDEYIVQKDPCFRIHLPNNTALGYRPNKGDPDDKIGLHNDSEYDHPDSEINFMLSFGKQFGNNSCFIESTAGSEEFIPIEMKYGEFISFYGNKCKHFNKQNDTGICRLSLDFRIIPYSKYDNTSSKVSLHAKRKFLIGDYYVLLNRL
jgi:hypothetical protein